MNYSTVKESQPPSAFCKVARSIFTTSSPHTVNLHAPATPPKSLSSSSLPTGKLCTHCSCWKVVRRAKMLLTGHMRGACGYVKLRSKQTYRICTTDINIWNCIVSVRFVQVWPKHNPWKLNYIYALHFALSSDVIFLLTQYKTRSNRIPIGTSTQFLTWPVYMYVRTYTYKHFTTTFGGDQANAQTV